MDNGAGGADGLAGVVLGVDRSVCGRRWRFRNSDARAAEAIAERLGVPEIVGRLLAQRGHASELRVGVAKATRRLYLTPSPAGPGSANQARRRAGEAVLGVVK